VINVTNRSHVYVRLRAIKLFLRHALQSLPLDFVPFRGPPMAETPMFV